jgi:hypothetical protein
MNATGLALADDTLSAASPVLAVLRDSAEWFGRRALELGLHDVPSLEALAKMLATLDRDAAAMAALRDVAGGRHPISLLLADRAMLPLPPEAIPWPAARSRLGGTYHSHLVADYWWLRYRSFVLPMPIERVEAFFRTSWPNLRLFKVDDEVSEEKAVQFFRLNGAALEPAGRKRDVDHLGDVPPDGILVEAEWIAAPAPKWVPRPLPLPLGKGVTLLTVIDLRAVALPVSYRYETNAAASFLWSLRWDLLNLVNAEEDYFADSGRFFSRVTCASGPSGGAASFCVGTGHALEILAAGSGDEAGWTATNTQLGLAASCAIYVGQVSPALPATPDDPEGIPVCR